MGQRRRVAVIDTFASLFDPAATSSAIAALRERYHVAVILVTAHDRAKHERGILGADAIVLKPYDIEDLVAVVSDVCASNAGQRWS